MAKRPSTFLQRDVTRALKATVAAGIEVAQLQIDKNGNIVIVVGKPQAETNGHDNTSWDEVLHGNY